jgi:transcriptional regulator GlxA family with amidase domain
MAGGAHDRPVPHARRLPRSHSISNPRRLSIVVYPEVQALDVTGPHEVFAMANRMATDPPAGSGLTATHPTDVPPYVLEVVAAQTDVADPPGAVRCSSGLAIVVDRLVGGGRQVIASADRDIDTVMVAGGQGTVQASVDRRLLTWLVGVAPSCRRVASVCSGAFVLAAAGLLDGKRATTHWSECETLRELFPRVQVEDDPIFVRDGKVSTSAGITAGMDLALAFVEEDLGRELALAVSRWLVMFVQRSGGQSQFSLQLAAQLANREPLRDLQAWIIDHPDQDLRVAALAERAAMSPRHFARVFREEVGLTPAQYVEQVRVEVARRLLESTDRSLQQVALGAGFGTVETLKRAFHRSIQTTPRAYRRHFTRSGAHHE